MSRFPPIPPELQTPAQKETHAAMMCVRNSLGDSFVATREDGAMVGPFASFIRIPAVISEPMLQMAHAIINNKDFALKERQLSVLAVCSVFHAEFMTYAHICIGKDVGLTSEQTYDARHGRTPNGLTNTEELAYDFSLQLAESRKRMPDVLFERAKDELGEEKVMALVNNVGLYTYTSMVMNASGTPIPDGMEFADVHDCGEQGHIQG